MIENSKYKLNAHTYTQIEYLNCTTLFTYISIEHRAEQESSSTVSFARNQFNDPRHFCMFAMPWYDASSSYMHSRTAHVWWGIGSGCSGCSVSRLSENIKKGRSYLTGRQNASENGTAIHAVEKVKPLKPSAGWDKICLHTRTGRMFIYIQGWCDVCDSVCVCDQEIAHKMGAVFP